MPEISVSSQWVIIPVFINILKGIHIIKAIGTREDSTYLFPYCLFKVPILSIKYVQISYTYLPFFEKSNPKSEPATDKKNKNHGQLQKATMNADWSLLHSRWQGWKWCWGQAGGGSSSWGPLRKKPTTPRSVSQTREAAERVRDGREVARVFTHQAVSQNGSWGETYTINIKGKQAHCQWEGPLQGVLEGWAEKAPEVPARDSGSPQDMLIPKEH